ncbi:hypothetical protein F383_29474 [Gossypium arboreum]|uniref:Uncharacterized protein n=1 Tax=Gossypium arboreum TaxID=29729 RepID=A0A0B0MZ95_GOSAR|nr:hypothetical protein F383_29474 [Gossypium arboreum]
MISREKQKIIENKFLLKENMERTKRLNLWMRECLQQKMDKICVTSSPIYSTKKPSLFLIKF